MQTGPRTAGKVRFADQVTYYPSKGSRVAILAEPPTVSDGNANSAIATVNTTSEVSMFENQICTSSESTFPALRTLANNLRAAADRSDVSALRSMTFHFIFCLTDELQTFTSLPLKVRATDDFMVAFRGTIICGHVFAESIEALTTIPGMSGWNTNEFINDSMIRLNTTVASFDRLVKLVAEIHWNHQALRDDGESLVPSKSSVLAAHNEVLDSPLPSSSEIADNQSSILSASIEEAIILPVQRADFRVAKGTLKRLMTSLSWGSAKLSFSTSSLSTAFNLSTFSTPPGFSHTTARKVAGDPNKFFTASHEDAYFSSSGVLCAASLKFMVRMLVADNVEPAFLNFFFTSFRFFTTPVDLLHTLLSLYTEPNAPAFQINDLKAGVVDILLLWLRVHWRPEWDATLLDSLGKICFEMMSGGDKWSHCWSKVLSKVNETKASSTLTTPGIPCLARQTTGAFHIASSDSTSRSDKFQLPPQNPLSLGKFNAVDILSTFHSPGGHIELARQLALAASELFRAADPEGAVRHWSTSSGPGDDSASPLDDAGMTVTLRRLTSFENGLSFWAANTIVSQKFTTARVHLLECFVEVARSSLKLNNFSAACALSAGIGMCVTRLPSIVEELSEQARTHIAELENLFNLRNRTEYRSILSSVRGAHVPLISTFKHDIDISLCMRRFSRHGKGLIDLERYRVVARTIQSMRRAHTTLYTFKYVLNVHMWLQFVLGRYASLRPEQNLNELDRTSRSAEPRLTEPGNN